MGRSFRRAAALAAALAGLWSAYWLLAARGIEGGARSWLEQRAEQGWLAEYSDIGTDGYPLRFETRLRGLRLADPRAGLAWEAPRFRFHAPSYRPNRITAVWPETQLLATPLQKIAVASDAMEAGLRFRPGRALALDALTARLEGLRLDSSLGWSAGLEAGRLTLRRVDDETADNLHFYEMVFRASRLRPSGGVLRWLDPSGSLPDSFDSFRLEARLGFDAPWDRFAIERRRPQPRLLQLQEASAHWGRLRLRFAGALEVDERGIPDGRIEVRATGWREILRLAVDTGLVSGHLLPTLERAFEFLASASGSPDTLEAPLIFRDGRLSFGPIPLGPAPRLRLR